MEVEIGGVVCIFLAVDDESWWHGVAGTPCHT
jgi:hypothetical protein